MADVLKLKAGSELDPAIILYEGVEQNEDLISVIFQFYVIGEKKML